MKFPTYEEMGQEVANRALDEYEYKGKTLREWVEIISAIPVTAIPATDNNVGTKLGTNLAEVGTDCISRQAAIDATKKHYRAHDNDLLELIAFDIERLPSAQPEPKRGKWIEITNSRCVVVALRCSRCEKSPRHGVRSDFCPNCGADMREVNNESN